MLELFARGDDAAWLGSFRFAAPLRPRLNEVDVLGHVSNVVYPAYLEFGRMQYFAAIGDPEPGPFPFIHFVAELRVRYVARCFYDEPLEVRSKVAAVGRSSAAVEQAIVGPGISLRAIAVVTIVRFTHGGSAPWTQEQKDAIAAYEPAVRRDR